MLGQLDAGGTGLSDGLNQLENQVPTLVSGVSQLNDGAQQLQAGLLQLQGSLNGTPTFAQGVQALVDGATQVEQGLVQLQGQLPALSQGVDDLVAGAQQLSGGFAQLESSLDGQFGPGLNQLASDLTAAAGAGGLADRVIGGIGQIQGSGDCGPDCQAAAAGVSANVNTVFRDEVQAAADGATQLNGAYTTQIRPAITQLSDGVNGTATSPGLLPGLLQLQSQVPTLVAGAGISWLPGQLSFVKVWNSSSPVQLRCPVAWTSWSLVRTNSLTACLS